MVQFKVGFINLPGGVERKHTQFCQNSRPLQVAGCQQLHRAVERHLEDTQLKAV